jgi:hypothetical protein
MTLIGHQGQVRRPARSARQAYGSSPLVKSTARERVQLERQQQRAVRTGEQALRPEEDCGHT